MRPEWRRLAPWALYLALLALLAALALYFVQREWNRSVQVAVILGAVGLAASLLLDPEGMQTFFRTRQARRGGNALIMTIAFAGILVMVNLLAVQNTEQWDLTEDQENQLAPETLETLAALPFPVTALAFYTEARPTEVARELLERYEHFADGKFSFRFLDPNRDVMEANQANIDRDGVVVLQMGDLQEQVTLISEQELTGGLVRLMNPGERAVYFLTGHGERDPNGTGEQSYTQIKAFLERKNYTVGSLNLLSTPSIPDDADVLIVAGPIKPLTGEEVTLISDYVSGGGSLIVMEEPPLVTEFGDDPDPLADYLLESWGIAIGRDIVVDLSTNQPFNAWSNTYDATHPITSRLQGLATVFVQASSVRATRSVEGVTHVDLILTAEQSWAERDLQALEDQGELVPDEGLDLLGPVPLAVTGEHFASDTRVVVIGDSDFASNARFNAFGNGDMFVNAVDWAAGQEQLINLTPRQKTQRILLPPQTITINLIYLGLVFLLPGAVMIAGIIVWYRRRRETV